MPVSVTLKCSLRAALDARLLAHVDEHVAVLGELDRVADQVGQHLLQPRRIADRRRPARRGRCRRSARAPSGARASASGLSASAIDRAQRERHRLELELARLDLREVEDVVEDRQQRIGRARRSSRQSRCSAVSSLSSASSVMPMMPFIGVRISWLMLARNSLLARLASIALSRAEDELLIGGTQLRGADVDRPLEAVLVTGAAARRAAGSRPACR